MRSFGNFFILAFSVCVLSIFTSCESNDFDFFTTVDDNKNATITHETSDKLLEPHSVEETDSFSAEFALRTDVPKANVYITFIAHLSLASHLSNAQQPQVAS